MAAVFDEDLPASEKLVLLALSDHADDAGNHCFPSVSRLVRKTSMTRRGVQIVLRRLEAKGKIRAIGNRPDGTVEYIVTLDRGGERYSRGERNTFAGEGRTKFAGGANTVHGGGEPYSPESSVTINKPSKEKIVRAPVGRGKHSSSLPDEFKLDTDMIAFANAQGIDSEKQFAKFRDHHQSKGSRFKDWKAAWRTWVRNSVEFSQRAQSKVPPGPMPRRRELPLLEVEP